MTTFPMIETAKRTLSSDRVGLQADNVFISRRFGDHGEFEAIKFSANGTVTRGTWTPDADWQYPEDITEGESGTFTPNAD